MTRKRGRVGIVGGSVAGCAAAIAAVRGGAGEVQVWERTGEALADRGVGMGIFPEPYATLVAGGYVGAEVPFVAMERRLWVVRDGEHPTGRVLCRQPFPVRAFAWSAVWRWLRASVPARVRLHWGTAVSSVTPDGDVLTAGGDRERFDVVVGADGYRSAVRATLFPGSRPASAGYVAWRGSYPAERLPGRAGLWAGAHPDDVCATVCFPGGHMMSYLIPAGGGGRSVNWVVYMRPPAHPALRADDPMSLPPGTVPRSLAAWLTAHAAEHLPPHWARVIEETGPDELSIQPLYDLELPTYARGRVMLLGDSGSVLRPHTGSGVAKALHDAHTFEAVARDDALETWADVLAAYSAERQAAGQRLVAYGRRLGAAQVEHTPDWASMTEEEMLRWVTEGRPGA